MNSECRRHTCRDVPRPKLRRSSWLGSRRGSSSFDLDGDFDLDEGDLDVDEDDLDVDEDDLDEGEKNQQQVFAPKKINRKKLGQELVNSNEIFPIIKMNLFHFI